MSLSISDENYWAKGERKAIEFIEDEMRDKFRFRNGLSSEKKQFIEKKALLDFIYLAEVEKKRGETLSKLLVVQPCRPSSRII